MNVTKNKPSILFGLEIECSYNVANLYGQSTDLIAENKGSYHDGEKVSTYWTCEGDGSLDGSHKCINGNMIQFNRTAEFVSVPFKHEQLKTVMQDLISNVFKNKHLNNVMDINDSCGNHVHFSILNGDDSKKTEIWDTGGNRRRTFKGSLRGNTLTHKGILRLRKDLFKMLSETQKNRYFRTYAKKHVFRNFFTSERYKEINFIDSKHYELRSLNFTGVKTWTELIRLYDRTLGFIEKHALDSKSEKWNLKKEIPVTENNDSEEIKLCIHRIDVNDDVINKNVTIEPATQNVITGDLYDDSIQFMNRQGF